MTDEIKRLREITGAGVMDCNKALKDAGGDFDKAVSLINERGVVKAEKRKDRETGAGILLSYIHNERVGVLLDLRSETDFVAKSDPFKNLAHELVMQIAAMDPENVDALKEEPYVKDESMKVKDLIEQVIAKTGENIRVNKFARFEI